MESLSMKTWFLSLSLLLLAGCDQFHTGVRNNSDETISLAISVQNIETPYLIDLAPGKEIGALDPTSVITRINIIAPKRLSTTYDTRILQKLARDAGEPLNSVRWSLIPQGIVVIGGTITRDIAGNPNCGHALQLAQMELANSTAAMCRYSSN